MAPRTTTTQIKYLYVKTPKTYEHCVTQLHQVPRLAIDLETYVRPQYKGQFILKGSDVGALNPHTGHTSLLAVKGDKTQTIIFDILLLERQGYNPAPLLELLQTRDYLLAHQAQFEARFLKGLFGVMLTNWRCTMLMSQLIDNAAGSKAGRARGHGLADICRDLLNVHLSGKGNEQVIDWYARPDYEVDYTDREDPWVKKLEYLAGDVTYLLDCHDLMLPVICDSLPRTTVLEDGADFPPYGWGMRLPFLIDMASIAWAAEMQFNGLPVSEVIFNNMADSLTTGEGAGELEQCASELCSILGLPTTPSFFSEYDVPLQDSYKALNSPARIKQLVSQQVGLELDNAQASVLERILTLLDELGGSGTIAFIDEDEKTRYGELLDLEQSEAVNSSHLLKLLLKYRHLEKQRSMDLRQYINPATRRIHPAINLLGAATGRTSSARPNAQNISGMTSLKIWRKLEDVFPVPLCTVIPDVLPRISTDSERPADCTVSGTSV